MAHSPLAQFEVRPLIPLQFAGYDISFTNASLFMMLSVLSITLFVLLGMRRGALVPGRFQSMVEMSYQFVSNLMEDSVGKEGMRYFPLMFCLFMFILFCNLFGMLPYSFTVTSHIIVTFALAICLFIGITMIGFVKHGWHFLLFFVPKGLPTGIGGFALGAFMVVIELFSYLVRPVTLSIRLAANMMAGHILLKVVAGFIVAMGIMGIFPFAFLLIFTAFEIFVACLQAYIFAMLCSIYLNDALHMH